MQDSMVSGSQKPDCWCWPLLFPTNPKRNTETFVIKLLYRRHTAQGLCRLGLKQRWAPWHRGAALGFPFRWITEALSSFSAAHPRHINSERYFWAAAGPWRPHFIAMWRKSKNPGIPPIRQHFPSRAHARGGGWRGSSPPGYRARSLQLQECLGSGTCSFF